MLIVLPRSKDIKSLEKTLILSVLKQWRDGLIFQKVNVFLPKFKFDARYEMGDILNGMGMKLAFDKQNADFSGMTVCVGHVCKSGSRPLAVPTIVFTPS